MIMKKLTTALLAVCAAAVALTSCRERSDNPEFASIDKNETFREGDGTFELDYLFEYLSWYSDNEVEAKIRTAMIADFFGDEYVRVNPIESATAFDQGIADMYVSDDPAGHKWSGFLKIRSHRDVLNERIVAYTVERQEYMGGAHGMETVMYYNYDLRTGDRLTLDVVFTPEGKAALAERIRVRILEEHQKDNWEELNEEGCFFAADSVQATENFLLSNEHITFMYNPYDIACFAQGRTEVKLPLDRLEGFKKEVLVR